MVWVDEEGESKRERSRAGWFVKVVVGVELLMIEEGENERRGVNGVRERAPESMKRLQPKGPERGQNLVFQWSPAGCFLRWPGRSRYKRRDKEREREFDF